MIAIAHARGARRGNSTSLYAVIRIDTARPVEGGVEGIVDSLHWSKEVAEQTAAHLNLLALNDFQLTGGLAL